MKNRLLCLAFLSVLASTTQASESYSVKALMMKALNSTDGTAKGIVEGKVADKIHETTGSYDPLRAEVKTLKRYKEEGCSRLAVKLTQPNTPTKQGTKTDFSLNYELDLCKHGMPPQNPT
ncbi:MAG: hypothetical protein Q8O64_20765 [Sideroxyarcus sp.]|nr:hypothetical protein [Sideroxyarcus sp.]